MDKEIFSGYSKPTVESINVKNIDYTSVESMTTSDSYRYNLEDDNVVLFITRTCRFLPQAVDTISVTYSFNLSLKNSENVTEKEIFDEISSNIKEISSDAMSKISFMISCITSEIFGIPLVTVPFYRVETDE